MQTSRKSPATGSDAAKPMANHNNRHSKYKGSPSKSSTKLKEQLGQLLAYLESPLLSQEERKQGYKLFEASLRKYLTIKNLGVRV